MKQEFLEAGEIVSTHGIRGMVKVLPWADGPEIFQELDRVYVKGQCYALESASVQKTCALLKLSGVDTVEAAQALRSAVVKIRRDDLELEDGVYFIADLIGLTVLTEENVEIGKITDVLQMPGNDVYEVKGEKEYSIPAVQEFILETNVDEGYMKIKLIEGMQTDAD